jgi:hypothetical protein
MSIGTCGGYHLRTVSLVPLFIQLAAVAGLLAAGQPLRPEVVATAPSDAPIKAWVLHVVPDLAEHALPTYADLIEAIPGDVELIIACGAGVDGRGFCRALGLCHNGRRPVTLLDGGAELSPWARDRYLIVPSDDAHRVLLPRPESVASTVAGDCDVGRLLVEEDPDLELVETELAVEGGDVLVCDRFALVGAGTILANSADVEGGADDVKARLERLLDREVVVVGDPEGSVPHEHLDMYLSSVGGRRVLLGDPRLTRGFFLKRDDPASASPEARSIGVFSWETQLRTAPLYDALARGLEEAGFSVRRVPILHTDDGELVTWNNAVTDRCGTRRVAYVPVYGIPILDDMARRIWTKAGYAVKPIRCVQVIREGGAVRCLTNALRAHAARDQPPPVVR